jgi:DNA-binding transcriptional LysR family regulator
MQLARLTLKQLRVFVAVARTGSTTAASQEIGLSQSATSSAVQELESALGVPLFERVGKRLLPNDTARALEGRAKALLQDALAFESAARGEFHRHALRIGASTTIGNYVLPELLARFYGRDPAEAMQGSWRSEVKIANTGDICRAVADFDLDVGIVEGPNHEPALHSEPWLDDEMLIVAAPDDALASGGEPLAGPLLREATWLLREPGSGTREVTDLMLLPHLGDYQRVHVLASSEAIKRAAAAGVGIACLSRWVVDEMLADGRLRALATVIPPIRRQCYVVTHRARHPSPVLSELLAVLQQALNDAVG